MDIILIDIKKYDDSFLKEIDDYKQSNTYVNVHYLKIYIMNYSKCKNGFIKLLKLYKYYKKRKILWEIAEYYTRKKYHPDKILNYIDLN